jgi:hypothetical protein
VREIRQSCAKMLATGYASRDLARAMRTLATSESEVDGNTLRDDHLELVRQNLAGRSPDPKRASEILRRIADRVREDDAYTFREVAELQAAARDAAGLAATLTRCASLKIAGRGDEPNSVIAELRDAALRARLEAQAGSRDAARERLRPLSELAHKIPADASYTGEQAVADLAAAWIAAGEPSAGLGVIKDPKVAVVGERAFVVGDEVAGALIRYGRLDEAEEYLRGDDLFSSDKYEHYTTLAMARLRAGDRGGAERAIRSLTEEAARPGVGEDYSTLMWNLASLHLTAGNRADAADAAREVLRVVNLGRRKAATTEPKREAAPTTSSSEDFASRLAGAAANIAVRTGLVEDARALLEGAATPAEKFAVAIAAARGLSPELHPPTAKAGLLEEYAEVERENIFLVRVRLPY